MAQTKLWKIASHVPNWKLCGR